MVEAVTWAKDVVRFELYSEQEGCQLVFIEKIHTITNHTPKDLAGWHVCLVVIKSVIGWNNDLSLWNLMEKMV
ncbi:hypothetical protein BTO28_05030 [Domibacillus epiphyticus]|uniref:Uncharacterized protein n=1 Tax=Domibacillus epiphyticus TaxID=1714355 RepID=A0A1V2AAJ1_9BACI|nr:hypothetical protein BTO28_05030 [Domibacillus epiphyticus]